MAELLPLEQLLAGGRALATPVALRDRTVIDFGSFRREVAAWRCAFARQPGQHWALYLEDSVAFAAALFGAWHAHKCVWLAADQQPQTLAALARVVDGFASELLVEQPGQPDRAADLQFAALDVDAMLLVAHTSGSSGEPLAIRKRLAQLFSEVRNLECCWPRLPHTAQVLATVSHQHIYGLLFRVLWPLASGRLLVAERLSYPEQLHAALLQSEQAVVLVSSPAQLKRLPPQLPWASSRSALAAVFSSGGPLPIEAVANCQSLLALTPIEVYGSSETGGIAWRQREQGAAALWRALPGVELRVEGEHLEVRSAHLPDHNWQRSADRVQLSEAADGFELLGRADRIVKIEEQRVSLTQMEDALLDSELLSEARVLSLGAAGPGQRNSLVVVAVPNAAGWACWESAGKLALNAALRDRLRSRFAASVLPRRWRYLWALPVDSQGKSTERLLQDEFDPRRPQARLLQRSERQALLELEVDPRSPYFDGHFPTAPILPGVVQVDWALRFGRQLFALPGRFLRLDALKFMQVIKPGAVLQLQLDFAAERASLSFRYSSSAGQHATGRIVFEAPA